MKFQIPNMLHSKVNRRTHTHTQTPTDRQTSRKQYALPTFSKLGNFFKIGGIKTTEFYCENYFVDENNDCECGCNDNGHDNNGLVQFHILVSSKLSIVSLKVFTVTV